MNQKVNQTGADLGGGPIASLLFHLALPAILAQIINLLYNVVDRMYIGHIAGQGPAALTGVGVCMPVITTISAFAALVSMGGAPRASILLGKKQEEDANYTLNNCLSLLIVLALTLTAVLEVFGPKILGLFGASDLTLPYAWNYLKIYAMGTIFVQVTLGMNAFINAQGFSKMGMMTVAIGALINIILDPIFIFVFSMGVQGAALATILSQAISCIWVLRFLMGPRPLIKVNPKYMRLKSYIILPCIALGLAPFIMQFTESILSMCFNTSLLKYGGNIAVGSITILTSTMNFAMMPLMGMCQGAQPIISFNYGAGNIERVKKAFRLLLTCCLAYSCLIWALAMLFPGMFVGMFTADQELYSYAVWAMRIYMAVMGIFGIQIACQQTFVSLGNAPTSMFLALLRKVFLLIPLIYLLPVFFADKCMAVFLAEPAADLIAVTTTSILFARQYRKLSQESNTQVRTQ